MTSGSYSLSSPISVTPPPITNSSGSVKTFNPLVLTSLYVTTHDDVQARVTYASLRFFPKSITLWGGHFSGSIPYNDNWADADVDSAITEFLGSDPAAALLTLFPNHA